MGLCMRVCEGGRGEIVILSTLDHTFKAVLLMILLSSDYPPCSGDEIDSKVGGT